MVLTIFKKIKAYLFPVADDEVKKNIDSESLQIIIRLSLVVMVVELLSLAFFLLTVKEFNESTWFSIGSVLFCTLTCFAGFFFAGRMLRSTRVSHQAVTGYKIVYCLVLLVWAVFVSYRHYLRGEQLLTFFAVEMMLVCFVPLRPVYSIIIQAGVYAGLYFALYRIDGAAGINVINYVILAVVSTVGMIVRCVVQVRMSEKAVQLKKNNALLVHANRHDALTGLRNRLALDEDAEEIVGHDVAAYMIDIDYFKEINDTYGHAAGDAALRAVAVRLKELFPGSRCYRYGGDEFLVLCTEGKPDIEEVYSFADSSVPKEKILLCVGKAEGKPEDQDQLFTLIAAADAGLYEVKRKTHTPSLGGHDRRRRP